MKTRPKKDTKKSSRACQYSGAQADVLIVGTGIAGLSTALKCADAGMKVFLSCKSSLEEGATRYAQGGIASVWAKDDSFEHHRDDTLKAGAGLCEPRAVDLCVKTGPQRVQELIELGVNFTRKSAKTSKEKNAAVGATPDFDLHREGGHGRRRILHADDLTGWEIERALIAQISQGVRKKNIRLAPHCTLIDLIIKKKGAKEKVPLGAYLFDEISEQVFSVAAPFTVLATGGAGKAYLYTSNPDTATGDGIAVAYRAGAKVSNLEFMQFHPTCLYHPVARTYLISEALRGEGAKLRSISGRDFMKDTHPLGALAPRDIVARAIDAELKRTGAKHVWLDATHLPAVDLRSKFPNIFQMCKDHGIDITRSPIPVVPAAHYTCGGIKTNLRGESSLKGLFAVGEVACTGLHGANRLASNSLLEAVVFAHEAATEIKKRFYSQIKRKRPRNIPIREWEPGKAVKIEEQIDIASNWFEVRSLMWNYVGIVRSNRRLKRAIQRIELLKKEIHEFYWNYLLTRDLLELRNLVTVAELMILSAQKRKESRGLHFTVDYPKLLSKARDTDLCLSSRK